MLDERRENTTSSETTVKITSKQKDILEEIIECIKVVFNCEVTSPKMYNDEKDVFFQYISVSRRV